MQWVKHGRVFQPDATHSWMKAYAQVPTLLALPDRLRIYFATRPHQGLSLPAFVDVDRRNPGKVIYVHEKPVLDVGRPGTFDADGVMPASVIVEGERILMYYSGWCRLGGLVPYQNATGVAVSEDGGTTFTRLFDGPILDRSKDEPWTATSPAVIRDKDRWYMWYSSGTDWIEVDGKFEHVYVLKAATSKDGLTWERNAKPIFSNNPERESQTRPTVFRRDGKWHMLFCFRGIDGFRDDGETYRLGYASSNDLIHWSRGDASAGLEPSRDDEWDSQMICYPEVGEIDGRLLLFYNGNYFGRDGFGYAVLEEH